MKVSLSISAQILLAVLVTAISVLGFSSIIDLNSLKQRNTQALQDEGAKTADRIANSLAYPLWNLNHEETERVVLDEISWADVSRISVFDEHDVMYVEKARSAESPPLYSFSRDVDFKNTRIGRVTLDVTDTSLQAALRDLRRATAIKLVVLVLLLSVVLFVALRGLVIGPVSSLKAWVEEMPATSTEHAVAPRFARSGEINALAEAFARMSLDLRRKNDELEGKHAQLRALSARLQSAREEEGARIAREIHDEMGSGLTSLKWDLERLAEHLPASEGGAWAADARDRIRVMTRLIESTVDSVRRISAELRPGILDDLGLVAAIEWQAQQFQARTGITYIPHIDLGTREVDRDTSTAVFRIFQEILTNVMRHANATSFSVRLQATEGDLALEVHDDGRGITEQERHNTRSLGLLGMKERALLAGGDVTIDGAAGAGTTVTARFPLTAEAAASIPA